MNQFQEEIIKTIIENKLIILAGISGLIISLLKYWVSKSRHKTFKGFIQFLVKKNDKSEL